MPRMQQRRDTSGNWTSANPVLASGEFGLETDTGKFKIGDGTSVWSALNYGGDPVLASVSITASVNDYALPTGDIFRIQNTAATGTVNITGLATANGGVAKLLVNVSTHTSCSYTLKHADTNSTAVSRLLVPWEGDYVLYPKGGAALVVYDDTDERWRVV